ncbi:hypothetical protein BDK51DRAFT_9529, partial [Blyttiomyces helicus]
DQSYTRLKSWIEASIDKYKVELRKVLYPVFVHVYLDLTTKGLKDQAKHFFDLFNSDHAEMHGSDIQRLSTLSDPQHVKENDLAQRFRNNKFCIRMSKYGFELLLSYLSDNRFMLLLRLINEHISIQ